MWLVEPEESFTALDKLLALCETFYQQARPLVSTPLVTHLHASWRFSTVSSPCHLQPHHVQRRRRYALSQQASLTKTKYEIECLLPGTKHHRALARISNLTDYRSRQFGIRYGPKKQGDLEKRHAAIVSAQMFAVPPLICAMLEQHQSVDGVKVPASLRPFVPQPTLPYLPVSK